MGLHVDEILIFEKNQFSETLTNTYALSNYGCYNNNILKF
jgi:hypothetical protein